MIAAAAGDTGRAIPGRPLDAADRPVFVIGAPRSGVDILMWGLAQHPAFTPVIGATWIGALGSTLEYLYRMARAAAPGPELSRMPRELFYDRFGRVAGELVLGSGESASARDRRWIAGGTDYSRYPPVLRRLFPAATFVHVVRRASDVVDALHSDSVKDAWSLTDRSPQTEDTAYAAWLDTVRGCLAAERGLGSAAVLRVRYDDLTGTPEATLRECLEFLGEPFDPACLRPLRAPAERAARGPRVGSVRLRSDADCRRQAEELSRRVLSETPCYAADADGLHALEAAFDERSTRELSEMAGWPLASRVCDIARVVTPPGANILVVSRGDEALLAVSGRAGWHFPQDERGQYAGFYPADSAAAIEHLERVRARGGDFLLFPRTAFWWLDHYADLARYLDQRYRLIWRDDRCVIYRLQERRDRAIDSEGPQR